MNNIELNYEDLIKKYPILFKQRNAPQTETCMCWGIEAGIGWYKSLNKCCSYLEELNHIYYNKYKIRIQADQIKSKWAELRFYFSIIDEDFINNTNQIPIEHKFINDMLYNITNTLIKQCEEECWNTCEFCGADGGFKGENLITTSHGWISRICKKCAKGKADYEIKHYDEINKQEYIPRITWFHDGYEFLSLYHINGFRYKDSYYYSIIEAFYCEKNPDNKKIYQEIGKRNNDKSSPYLIEKVANQFACYCDETYEYEDNRLDYNLLKDIVKEKFTYEYNKNIKKELIKTDGKLLQYMGKHHNNILGYCICDECKNKEHKDLYSKILMEIREEFINNNK